MTLIKTSQVCGIVTEIFLIGETKAYGWSHKLMTKTTLENGTFSVRRYHGRIKEEGGELSVTLGHQYSNK